MVVGRYDPRHPIVLLWKRPEVQKVSLSGKTAGMVFGDDACVLKPSSARKHGLCPWGSMRCDLIAEQSFIHYNA